ncbi:UDP-N-acetylmuramoyl-tripeptide--D-alanyl-D-alanine ligase [Pistricoccus aurantiacus]|uniref:UDP-N-acetylmuramoyl-tripeptide--D-alanyl-D- alanine ligase n=1 Tax=Pistricoccus aurantiacus TaxID=1883414 RepID=UPI0036331E96
MSATEMWTLGELAKALGCECPIDTASRVESIITDSRKLASGQVFVALLGERFDGHEFISRAREAGALAAVVSRRVDDPLPQLMVPDTRLALGLLGQARRLAWDRPLAAITGNSGKTTVKEILAALLATQGPVLATRGNLNNDIGAPLTLLELTSRHRQAVVELGANHLGEIAWTCALAKPNVAVITNVTGAHVGEFGGLGNIAQAKGEILCGLAASGVAVLNRDDRFFPFWRRLAGSHEVLDFGFDEKARLRGSNLVCDALGRYAVTLHHDGRCLGRVQLALMGRHNVANVLAASAAALAMGLSADALAEALAKVEPLSGRLSLVKGIRHTRLLDDTYNANPGAVKAALDLLAALPAPRWCLLGAMGELGDEAASLHAEIGHHARCLGIDFLGTLGEPARSASGAFGDNGHHFDDWEALARHARDHLPAGASVLVKGSRSAGMERLIEALRCDGSR